MRMLLLFGMASCILGAALMLRGHDADEQETRECAAICRSEYVEVIEPRYMRGNKVCLCPATGGDGPRGPHWTLAYLDGGTP